MPNEAFAKDNNLNDNFLVKTSLRNRFTQTSASYFNCNTGPLSIEGLEKNSLKRSESIMSSNKVPDVIKLERMTKPCLELFYTEKELLVIFHT